MEKEQLTPHQRAEQALRAIDTLSEGRVATDEQWAEVLKQPNVLPSLEIVAAAIEAGAKPAVSVTSQERAERVIARLFCVNGDLSNFKSVVQSLAEAIESAVQQERHLIYQVLNEEEAMYRNAAEEYEKVAMYEEQHESIIRADYLVSIISRIALSVAIRSRSTPPVSADNKETNV